MYNALFIKDIYVSAEITIGVLVSFLSASIHTIW